MNLLLDRQEELKREIELLRAPAALQGRVAGYIPELSHARADCLGIFISTCTGEEYFAGEYNVPFTLQSIAKVFSLAMALSDCGEDRVFSRVGMEPSGDPFNSIARLETAETRKPYNPMINAGAIAVCSLICGDTQEGRFQRVLSLIRAMAGNVEIDLDPAVYRSEWETADHNRAMAYFMKGSGILQGDVENTLDLYIRICSIRVDCRDLARMACVLARDGRTPSGLVMPPRVARIVKRIMYTSGMYDASGEFAVQVGLPAKSGVSGGILAVVPGKMGIGVYGPAINEKGNSVGGVALLRTLAERWGLAPF